MTRRFGEADLTAEEVAAIQTVMDGTGARRDIADRIDRLVAASLDAIAAAPVAADARAELIDLANFVAGRNY